METLLLIALLVSLIGLLTSLVIFFNLVNTKNNRLLDDKRLKIFNAIEDLKK